MKLNFNFNFKGLDGKEVLDAKQEPVHAGKTLAQFISATNSGNSIKLWDWALKIYNDKPLEVDATDIDVLSELINKGETLTILAKAQLMSVIGEAKDKDKEKK
jgi:hypothetical protein